MEGLLLEALRRCGNPAGWEVVYEDGPLVRGWAVRSLGETGCVSGAVFNRAAEHYAIDELTRAVAELTKPEAVVN